MKLYSMIVEFFSLILTLFTKEKVVPEVKTEIVILQEAFKPSKPDLVTATLEDILFLNEKFFGEKDYIKEETEKYQIVLHHTASGDADSVYTWWNNDPKRVITHIIIDRNGTVYQTMPWEYWGWHINVGSDANKINKKYKKNTTRFEKHSIGIEIVSWGWLTKKDDKYYSWLNKVVPKDDVEAVKFRGQKYFHKYTDAQVKSLEKLLLRLTKQFDIPIRDNYNDLFEISPKALNLEKGIWSHTSFRQDKSDIAPLSNITTMLNSLHTKAGK